MTSTQPLVSVIVPVYNGAKFVAEAVASLRQQNYSPLEIIVVDDGSTDNTAQIVATLGEDIRYVYQPNQGPSAAKNKGLSLAQGEIIGFLDYDDLWPPDKLQLQLPRLIHDPDLDIISGRIQYIQLPGAEDMRFQFEGPDNTITHICFGAALFKKRAFSTVGNFDESLRYNEDHDWFLRAREHNLKIRILQQITLRVRRHGQNMTHNQDTISISLLKVLKKSLDRRRDEGNGDARSLGAWSEYDEAGIRAKRQ